MENHLLLPSDNKKKKGRWSGRLMKRLFRRNKQKPDQTLASEAPDLNEEHSRYFTTLKDGIDELDLTTVNLSYSGGSVPYSTDDSLEAERGRRKKFSSPAGTSTSRSSDVSFSSDPLDTSRASQEGMSNMESTFAQLDVPNMQKSYGRNTPVDFENGFFESGFESSFVIHTRSTLDQSRVLEDTCPLGSSDHGMEVVLFDQEEDNTEDSIFMTFQTPADDEWRDPFNISIIEQNNVSASFSSTPLVAPPNCLNLKSLLSEEPEVPPSPALSQQSETSVTWVSHDDDDGDERPMKEIIFPSLSDTAVDDLFLDCESINGLETSCDIVEEFATPRESLVRDEIFTQMELMTGEKSNGHKTPEVDASLRASSPFLLNSSGAISPRSAFTPRSNALPQPTVRLLPRQVHSDSNPSLLIEIDTSENQSSFNPSFPKTPSSAFLKRKSAFTGEDLLSQEAESFAGFLEEGHSTAMEVSAVPSEAALSPVKPKTPKSTAERLLHAMKSIDASDDENELADINDQAEAIAPVAVSDLDVVPLFLPVKGYDNMLSQSVDLSQSGIVTFQSHTTGQTASTEMFSKSLSDDDADDEEEFTNNASLSYASSTSFTIPSTFQGSASGGRKVHRKKNSGISHLPYCGVFIQEDIEEDEEDFDDMSLPSEDFSCQRESDRKLRRRQPSRRGETPLLDQVRNELMETVQDLAREGSSVVRSFLRTRP